jgi:hypothetical protein
MEEALQWRHGGDNPIPHERDVVAIRRAGLDGAPDLDGERNRLREEDRDEDEDVLKSDEERFHALQIDYLRDRANVEVAG